MAQFHSLLGYNAMLIWHTGNNTAFIFRANEHGVTLQQAMWRI